MGSVDMAGNYLNMRVLANFLVLGALSELLEMKERMSFYRLQVRLSLLGGGRIDARLLLSPKKFSLHLRRAQ
jgi:hypothetical protein